MAILFSHNYHKSEENFAELKAAMPGVDLRNASGGIGNPEEIDYAIVRIPVPGSLHGLPNLKAIFTFSAGVDALVNDPELPDVPLVRNVEPSLTHGMVEYIVYQVLRFHRNFHLYEDLQREHQWKRLPMVETFERRIGIMGLGEMGKACAIALRQLNFAVSGWSNSPKDIAGVTSFAGQGQLGEFLKQTDILVCLLPLTDATRGILNAELFAQLPKGAILINAARGAHQVEQGIIEALDNGQLSAAAIDVFQQEPLSKDHPFWLHPKITLTPHIASITDFGNAAKLILKQIEEFENGGQLKNVVDKKRQY
jgi:glyoxylate/hydroxypyruvate reductase A